ncbi:mucin-20 isoform a precursor [Homo sapiens]|uniref:Mucin-20 n=2 Tax=Homo sapiens TaxID=9606 RepID=MUC20_HUMAN|nr:mucin-20 isoform a precursor [Homo sapiens]Q8N307.3 RecName: Full=Mucin-20; Short=MUC-20; Flags: Precursor [Homo sapiens]|eukprot:NP_001269435.1 mucin-20 isoform a precursor [Homo sapiens]
MGCLWGLALPLFFFCWEVGVSGSSAGPSTRRADTAMTTDDTEVPAMTLAPGHAALETQTLSAETSSRASTPAGPIPEAETRGAKRISPARETRSFTKTSPNFMVLIATSVETSAASGSPEGAGMTTVQTITGSDPREAIFDTLCTDDSSEEAKTLTMDILTLAHTSTEAKGLSSESSASSDSPHPVITPSRASESSASSDGPHPVITPSRASESSASSDGPHPVITPSRASESSASSDGPHPVITPSRASESSASSDGPHPVITPSRASESSASSDGPHPVITPSRASESSASSDGPHPVITPSRASESSASSDGPHPVITPSRASESSASSDGPHPVITPSRASESSASSDGLHPVITPSRASESSASSDGPHPVITPSRASESSASSDGPHPVITPSWSPGSDVTLLAEALVTVTNIEVINCSITEIETTTSSIPGASDTDLIPTEGVKASSTSDPPALPDSTEAKPHITEVTASAETLSTAGTTESAAPDATVGTPLPTNSATEREVTAPGATTLSGALVTVSRNPLEETSALSVETPSYVKVSGAAPVSIEAGSAVGKTTSFAGSSASSYSPSEAALKNFTPSETPTMDIATKGPFPTSRDPLPSVPPTTTNSSRGTNSTLAKITTSAKTTMKPPTATPTTARTRPTTDVSAGENGGFLLLRLSVASPEDLTDPRVAERLMQQLHRELHAHAPHFQVSLLRVRRG